MHKILWIIIIFLIKLFFVLVNTKNGTRGINDAGDTVTLPE
jgi:hypothetical protein